MKKQDALHVYNGMNKTHFYVKRRLLSSNNGKGEIKGVIYSKQGLLNNDD